MKQLDFIHKYKHLLPSQYRKDFERDLLSVFVDDGEIKGIVDREIEQNTLLKKYYSDRQISQMELLSSQYEKQNDYFKTILDIECNPLKEDKDGKTE